MPNAAEQQLFALCKALKEQLHDPQWLELARLDKAIQTCLLAYPKAQLTERGLLLHGHLKQLHDQARVACAQECERLRLLLLRHLEYSEAHSAYGRIDSFREDR